MSSCCHHTPDPAPPPPEKSCGGCCGSKPAKRGFSFDPVMHGSLLVIALILAAQGASSFTGVSIPMLHHLSMDLLSLMGTVWWGLALGIVATGIMHQIPKAHFTTLLGRGDSAGGIGRALLAGMLFDLCSHGILMIGAKLYERGASVAQVMAFLIASPWNSLSLTFVMISMIGVGWTITFIAVSLLIAFVSGMAFIRLERAGVLAPNPNTPESGADAPPPSSLMAGFRPSLPSPARLWSVVVDGVREGKMIVRWILLGVLLAALIRSFVPGDVFADWFGPTLVGLLLTMVAATVIEVCSEGSAPIAADLVTRAAAPGNALAFLMAGVSTDYTEILVLRQVTGSWKTALFLPVVTLPQVLLVGWLLNQS